MTGQIESFVKLEYQRIALELQKQQGLTLLYGSNADYAEEAADVVKDINGLPVHSFLL